VSGQPPLGFLETLSENITSGTMIQIPNDNWYHKDGKSLEIFYDGVRMLENVDYTESDVGYSDKSNAVQFTFNLVDTKVAVFKENYGNPEIENFENINISWIDISNNAVVGSFQKVMVDTTTSSITLELNAAPEIGDEIQMIDKHGTFNTNNLILDGGTNKIMNQSNLWPISDNFSHITLVFVDNSVGWRIYS